MLQSKKMQSWTLGMNFLPTWLVSELHTKNLTFTKFLSSAPDVHSPSVVDHMIHTSTVMFMTSSSLLVSSRLNLYPLF